VLIIPLFIVWQGKPHRELYHPEGGLINEATFAVSYSDLMDNELGFEYMKEHFEPYTQCNPLAARSPIVDGHSSHIVWRVIKYALDYNIRMI